MEIIFNSIGYIKSPYKDVKEIPKQGVHSSGMGEIILDEDFQKGLKGLKNLNYIYVFFNFHKSKDYKMLQHRQGDTTTEKVGVFATRSPFRPNGIGMSIVKVLDISNNIIRFEGADMLDGTPVLDIKPYSADLNPEVK